MILINETSIIHMNKISLLSHSLILFFVEFSVKRLMMVGFYLSLMPLH